MTTTTLVPGIDDLLPSRLDEVVDSAGLLTRVDRKYALTAAEAGMLVGLAPAGTRVLEIAGDRSFGYTTTYLDTDDLLTYHLAAHRRRRRFKVRTRRYDSTGATYLEVKTRAGSRTVKTRTDGGHVHDARLDRDGITFVAGALDDAGVDGGAVPRLRTVLRIRYDRSTLHLPDEGTRVTLDRRLRWRAAAGGSLDLPDLVVVETKSPGRVSSVDRLLWSLGHRPCRISKYATGLAALDPDLPANRWARTLRSHFPTPETHLPGASR